MKQARIAESTIFRDIDYSGAKRLLEVGSGVGAQTEILLRRFPDLHATCVDLNQAQLDAARANLGRMPWLEGRYALQQADATDLPFEPRSFDAHSCAGCWSTCRHRRGSSARCVACWRPAPPYTPPK